MRCPPLSAKSPLREMTPDRVALASLLISPMTPLNPDRSVLLVHYAAMMEEVPVGLLLLNWAIEPQWFNAEAARRAFRLPAALIEACQRLRAQWNQGITLSQPHMVSDHTRGLHARIKLHAPAGGQLPAFHLQLDYRRPRGDRERALSPGAVALLARLTEREREVAMRVREGLRTREIATELHRSPLTIKTQLAAIFDKLNVRSRTRVAALLNR